MRALQIAGIIVGAWLAVGVAFIGPSEGLPADSPWRVMLVLVGLAAGIAGAYVLIRKTMRGRRETEVKR